MVQKGLYYHPDRDTPVLVAIKSLKGMITVLIYSFIYIYMYIYNLCLCGWIHGHVGDFSEQEVHAFLVESIQMKEFSHPHVMGLLGVSLDSGPSPYLVLPFMAEGSLLAFLKKRRSELVLKPDSETDV